MNILPRLIVYTCLLTMMSLIAFGQDASKTDPIRQGSYSILDSVNIEFIVTKDSLTPADLANHDLVKLNSLIIEYIARANSDIEPEVERKIRENPRHAELIRNSNYLFRPDDYFYQLLPMKNDRGNKLVWVKGTHSTKIDILKDLRSLYVIADGSRNMYFSFWVDLTTTKLLIK